jgi:hypothetical protein
MGPGFRFVRTPSVKKKKQMFTPEWRGEEGQSGRTFPPQRPRNSTWTCGGARHQGVNLDFQRRVMNCESSRNLPTGKCDVISGKSVGRGRPTWRKDFSSPGVVKPGTSGSESVLPVQRNVLNERARLHQEGTQQRVSIRLLFSTNKVFVLRVPTSYAVGVYFQFSRRRRRMRHILYYKRKNVYCILIKHIPSTTITDVLATERVCNMKRCSDRLVLLPRDPRLFFSRTYCSILSCKHTPTQLETVFFLTVFFGDLLLHLW